MGQFLFSPSKDKQLNTVEPDQAAGSGDPVESSGKRDLQLIKCVCKSVRHSLD